MSSAATPRQAILLLAAGAVALALVGWRVLLLEQTERERRAMRHSGLAVARAKADADRLARAPRGRPLAAWRIEGDSAVTPERQAGLLHWDRLRRVAALEGDPTRALAEYEALRDPRQPKWLRDIAALRSGGLLAALGQPAAAELLWAQAAEASPLLFGVENEHVRMMALRHLALAGLVRGDATRFRQLLEEAQDGIRLAAGGVMGPARLVMEFEELLTAPQRAALADEDQERLRRAVAHARRGLGVMLALPQDGTRLVEGLVAWRQGAQLLLFPVSSLVEPALPGFDPGFALERRSPGSALPPGAVRLAEPLADLMVRPVPVAGDSAIGWWVAVALGFGMLVYAVGAFVALAGWRRSRIAAVQQADFTAAVSHEMKTPIASVRAMAELLGDGGAQDAERTQRYLARIEAEMQRLGSTVRNVLDAANVERGSLPVHPVAGDPADLLESVAAVLTPALESRGFVVTVEAEPALEPVAFDAAALEGVLMNLVDNAAKFSAERKRVGLRGAPTLSGGYRIEVADRGLGLDRGNTERLFERYYRGNAAREGAVPGVGLGLHIAREVIEAHGGQLNARARTGGGAVFVIELPGAPIA